MGPNTRKRKDNSVNAYRKFKLKILKRDFRITITSEEAKYAETLTTESRIDQFFFGMINKYWG